MGQEHYEIYAVRYGHDGRRSSQNFLGGDPHDTDMPLDYFVWVIASPKRKIVLDTGYSPESGEKRGRKTIRPVNEGLAAIGCDHAAVTDVIISHLHYDHAGNQDLFPEATFHLQDAEMGYATGRCMCHHAINHPFDVDDVTSMVKRVYRGKVCFHEGDEEFAPGISLHHVGGHSRGLQIVRVETARGPVVLGSDAAHFYANMERGIPFPVCDSPADVLEGVTRMRKLAASDDHIIPGHDPLVTARYPSVSADLPDIVRLDLPPEK